MYKLKLTSVDMLETSPRPGCNNFVKSIVGKDLLLVASDAKRSCRVNAMLCLVGIVCGNQEPFHTNSVDSTHFLSSHDNDVFYSTVNHKRKSNL